MLALQSEANVCRHKCNLKRPQLSIAQDFQQKLGVTFSYLKRNYERRVLWRSGEGGGGGTAFVSYIGMPGFLSEILGVELNAHYG